MAETEAGVDAVPRAREIRLEPEVRRRVAERPAALVAGDDDAVELERPAEHRGRAATSPSRERRADRRRRDAGQLRHDDDLEAEPLEEREIARAADAEAEVLAGDDGLDAVARR